MSNTIVPTNILGKELVEKFKDFQSNKNNFDQDGNINLDIIDTDIQGIMLKLYDPIRMMCKNSEPSIKDNLERNLQKMFTLRYYDINCYKAITTMKRNNLYNIFNDLMGTELDLVSNINKSYGSFGFDSLEVNIISTTHEDYGLPFVIENINNGFSFEFCST